MTPPPAATAESLEPELPVVRSALPGLLFTVLGFLVLLAGCAKAEGDATAAPSGHMFANPASGVAVELPTIWAGRYRVTDSITAPASGLERQLALRFVKADSTVAEPPLLVIRVFSNTGWNAVPLDSSAAMWGTVIAHDTARTVAVKTADGNPLTAGTADALAFDSLMIAVIQRQMRASLRAPGR